MDPETVYRNIMNIVRAVLAQGDSEEGFDGADAVDDLLNISESFEALDGWLRKGGFPPKAWQKKGENR